MKLLTATSVPPALIMFIPLGSGTLGNGPKMADIDNMVLPGEKKQLPKLQVQKIRTTSPVCQQEAEYVFFFLTFRIVKGSRNWGNYVKIKYYLSIFIIKSHDNTYGQLSYTIIICTIYLYIHCIYKETRCLMDNFLLRTALKEILWPD